MHREQWSMPEKLPQNVHGHPAQGIPSAGLLRKTEDELKCLSSEAGGKQSRGLLAEAPIGISGCLENLRGDGS